MSLSFRSSAGGSCRPFAAACVLFVPALARGRHVDGLQRSSTAAAAAKKVGSKTLRKGDQRRARQGAADAADPGRLQDRDRRPVRRGHRQGRARASSAPPTSGPPASPTPRRSTALQERDRRLGRLEHQPAATTSARPARRSHHLGDRIPLAQGHERPRRQDPPGLPRARRLRHVASTASSARGTVKSRQAVRDRPAGRTSTASSTRPTSTSCARWSTATDDRRRGRRPARRAHARRQGDGRRRRPGGRARPTRPTRSSRSSPRATRSPRSPTSTAAATASGRTRATTARARSPTRCTARACSTRRCRPATSRAGARRAPASGSRSTPTAATCTWWSPACASTPAAAPRTARAGTRRSRSASGYTVVAPARALGTLPQGYGERRAVGRPSAACAMHAVRR